MNTVLGPVDTVCTKSAALGQVVASPPSGRERRDSVSELQVCACLTVTIALARSRSPPPTEKCTCTRRQLPAATFRNTLRQRRLSTACQECLQLIGVKLSECIQCELERRGNMQERKGAVSELQAPSTLLVSLNAA